MIAVADGRQLAHAFDRDRVGAGAGDARAHRVQHLGQALHLGLGGGVDDRRRALGEGGRHHRVLRAEDAGVVGEEDVAPQLALARAWNASASMLVSGPERAEALRGALRSAAGR